MLKYVASQLHKFTLSWLLWLRWKDLSVTLDNVASPPSKGTVVVANGDEEHLGGKQIPSGNHRWQGNIPCKWRFIAGKVPYKWQLSTAMFDLQGVCERFFAGSIWTSIHSSSNFRTPSHAHKLCLRLRHQPWTMAIYQWLMAPNVWCSIFVRLGE